MHPSPITNENNTELKDVTAATDTVATDQKKKESNTKNAFSFITDKMPTRDTFTDFNKNHPNLLKYSLFAVSTAALVAASAVAVRKLRK